MATPATQEMALQQFLSLNEAVSALQLPAETTDDLFLKIAAMIEMSRKVNRSRSSAILNGFEGTVGDLFPKAQHNFNTTVLKQSVAVLTKPALEEIRNQREQNERWRQILHTSVETEDQRRQVFTDLSAAGFAHLFTLNDYLKSTEAPVSDRSGIAARLTQLGAAQERIHEMHDRYVRGQ